MSFKINSWKTYTFQLQKDKFAHEKKTEISRTYKNISEALKVQVSNKKLHKTREEEAKQRLEQNFLVINYGK